jgi:hypothetical protein
MPKMFWCALHKAQTKYTWLIGVYCPEGGFECQGHWREEN